MILLLSACLLAGVRSHPVPDVGAISGSAAGTGVGGPPSGPFNSGGSYAGNFGYGGVNSGFTSIDGNNRGDTGAFAGPGGAFAGTGGSFASSYAGPHGEFPDYNFNSIPSYGPKAHLDFLTAMQKYFAAAAAAHEDAVRHSFESGPVPSGFNGVGASAYGNIGPQGGYGVAKVYPPPEGGVDLKIGDAKPISGPVSSVSGQFPPPGGNFYGVSSYSSSGHSNVNGKETSYKSSSVSVNDNGKVTTYMSHDP